MNLSDIHRIPLLSTPRHRLSQLREIGYVEESEFILKTVSALGVKSEVELDLTLARG